MFEHPANLSLEARFAHLQANALRSLSFDAEYADDFHGWQRSLRETLLNLMAVHPQEECEVTAAVGEPEDRGDYTRTYLRITSRDGVEIPAFLLRPKMLRAPAAAVVCLHGHGPGKVVPVDFGQDVKGRPVVVEGERDFALQAVAAGHIALAPDLRGFGELMLEQDLDADRGSSCQQLSMRAMVVGKNLLGMRVLDIMSCVDYLQGLEEVDAGKIICTGQSGGGTATLFATALDTRFAASVPSCYFCTFEHSIMAMSHCDCNYVPGLLDRCEMYDVAGLIAPRPLLIVAGREDSIFPLAGVQIAFERVQEMYRAAGAPDNVELYLGDGGHRYYKERVWSFVAESLA
jgi:cephalosporin-C deacetylase-like acetyl esterase